MPRVRRGNESARGIFVISIGRHSSDGMLVTMMAPPWPAPREPRPPEDLSGQLPEPLRWSAVSETGSSAMAPSKKQLSTLEDEAPRPSAARGLGHTSLGRKNR